MVLSSFAVWETLSFSFFSSIELALSLLSFHLSSLHLLLTDETEPALELDNKYSEMDLQRNQNHNFVYQSKSIIRLEQVFCNELEKDFTSTVMIVSQTKLLLEP